MLEKKDHIKYWISSAENDLDAAHNLFKSNNYLWCLFIGHLIIEKSLKAHWVNIFDETPPKIHDLVRLATKTNIELGKFDLDFLDELNKFNLEARYPDYKQEMYRICTEEYTTLIFEKIIELFQWLKSQLTY